VEAVFLIAAVLIDGVCLAVGFVPDPLRMMEKVRRDGEPARFYAYLLVYLFLGATLSIGSWLARDSAKNTTTTAVHAQKSE
jgi:hypothetical protein